MVTAVFYWRERMDENSTVLGRYYVTLGCRVFGELDSFEFVESGAYWYMQSIVLLVMGCLRRKGGRESSKGE